MMANERDDPKTTDDREQQSETSRRRFLHRCFWAAGGLMLPGGLSAIGCRKRGPHASSQGKKQGGTPKKKNPQEANVASKDETFEAAYLKLHRKGELKNRADALWRILSDCRLCGRKCRVDRLKGQKGICRSDDKVVASSAFAHFGEEAPLVGRGGSGTIFLSRCNLLCCYCQNWQIAHRGDGTQISVKKLAKMMVALQARGCHNINFVTPTHFIPQLVRAVILAIPLGLRLPLVYNTGGYDNADMIRLLDGIFDIYLPDFKYQDPKMGDRYSSGAVDYPLVAATAIKEMYRQVGDLKTDENGVARRGLMLRHLVMPNSIAGTERFVKWVAENLSKETYVNIMGQYHPAHKAFVYPKIARRVTPQEVKAALEAARRAGLKRVVS
jgi:putative pyruvate formate lyase activating enzyme